MFQTKITFSQAIGILEHQPVYARLLNGTTVQIGAIAWTTWTDKHYRVYFVDEVDYFFIKDNSFIERIANALSYYCTRHV